MPEVGEVWVCNNVGYDSGLKCIIKAVDKISATVSYPLNGSIYVVNMDGETLQFKAEYFMCCFRKLC